MFKEERLFAEFPKPWFSCFQKPCRNSALQCYETPLRPYKFYLFDEIQQI